MASSWRKLRWLDLLAQFGMETDEGAEAAGADVGGGGDSAQEAKLRGRRRTETEDWHWWHSLHGRSSRSSQASRPSHPFPSLMRGLAVGLA
jgi:hypothetical protein